MLKITWGELDPASEIFVIAVPQREELGELLLRLAVPGLEAAVRAADFSGKADTAYSFSRSIGNGLQQVVLLGVGDESTMSPSQARDLGYRASRAALPYGASSLALDVRGLSFYSDRGAECVAEGVELGNYSYDTWISDPARRRHPLRTVSIAGPGVFADASHRGPIVARAIMRARDLANGPAGVVTPSFLADSAMRMCEELRSDGFDASCKVLERDECEAAGMGLFLGVAQGSDTPPKFIHAVTRPRGRPPCGRICLIGKGITFDSGGYSLKSNDSMMHMKLDMSGAAVVFAALDGAARLDSPWEIHAISAAAENMVSGRAYRLGDVLRASNGKTVEINNTDAEGRLTLADALVYASKLDPDLMIDLATLTGAAVVALGPQIAGVMTPDDALAAAWVAAGDRAGEEMWRLPLPRHLMWMLESKIADLRNTGERAGGALTAGLFLQEFVGKHRWLHCDIAGPSICERPFEVHREGGTGFGVATLLELLRTERAPWASVPS